MTTQIWIQIVIIYGLLIYSQLGKKRGSMIRIILPIVVIMCFGSEFIISKSNDEISLLPLLIGALLGGYFFKND